MLQRISAKILTLVITICLLGGGIAPANPSCNAECCAKAKSNGVHSKAHAAAADLLPDCCSGIETAPCPHMLESSSEVKEYAIAAPAVEVNPAPVNLAASENSTFFSFQPQFHLTYSPSPNMRGPSVPLYLQTQTFLI
ncbi:MAG: hypothetical protein PVI74_15140 [Syntrophobacterales bacterium]